MPSTLLTDWLIPGAAWVFNLLTLSAVPLVPAGLILAGYGAVTGQAAWAVVGLAASIAAVPGIYARLVLPFRLRVKRLEIGDWRLVLPNLQSPISILQSPRLRVCFFTDLHTGRFKQAPWVRRVVDLANSLSPDVILVGGDYVSELDHHRPADLLWPLRELRAPLGVFAVLGNHDYGLPGPDLAEEVEALLISYGIRVLRNERAALNERVQLVGIDELWADRDDVDRAFAGVDPDRATIVLGHNPDLMAKIDQCAAVFLFGHTHGGQIYLPFAPGLGVPVKSKLYRGLHRLPQGPVYVSSGVGESTTPLRLGTQPEMVVFEV